MMKKIIASKIDLNTNCARDIMKASIWFHKEKFTNFYRMLALLKHRKNRKKYNIEIYPQCKLGKIIIPHSVGIVIGRTAEIGNNTIIMPNVVVGAKYSPKEKNPETRRHAIIGENCLLGSGSKIIGNIRIGNNVTIAANAVVTRNVPDNCIVYNVNDIVRRDEKNEAKSV